MSILEVVFERLYMYIYIYVCVCVCVCVCVMEDEETESWEDMGIYREKVVSTQSQNVVMLRVRVSTPEVGGQSKVQSH